MLHKKKLLGIASFRVINSFRNGIFISFLGIYLRENLQLSVTESNLLFTLLELIGALAQFFVWTKIIEKYQAKNSIIIIGESVPAIGYLGIFLFHNHLLATNLHAAGLSMVFGIPALEFFWGAGFVGFYALLSDVPGAKNRAKYLGYTISLTSAGHICGSFVGGILFDYNCSNASGCGFSEGILFFVLIPIIFGFVFLSWITRHETESSSRNIEMEINSSSDESDTNSISNEHLRPDEKFEPTLRIFYWLLFGIILSSMAQGAIKQITFFYLRLPESIELGALSVSLLVTARWLGFLVSGPIASKFSGQTINIAYLVTLGWFMVLPLLFPFVQSLSMALILYASNGICMGISSVTAFTIISEMLPVKKRGIILSRYNASRMVAVGSGGSLIGGPLADLQLSQGASLVQAYTFVFFTAFFMGILAIMITLWKARPAFQIFDTNR